MLSKAESSMKRLIITKHASNQLNEAPISGLLFFAANKKEPFTQRRYWLNKLSWPISIYD